MNFFKIGEIQETRLIHGYTSTLGIEDVHWLILLQRSDVVAYNNKHWKNQPASRGAICPKHMF